MTNDFFDKNLHPQKSEKTYEKFYFGRWFLLSNSLQICYFPMSKAGETGVKTTSLSHRLGACLADTE